MDLKVKGKETEVFDFLAALESTRKKARLRVDEGEEVGEGDLHGGEH